MNNKKTGARGSAILVTLLLLIMCFVEGGYAQPFSKGSIPMLSNNNILRIHHQVLDFNVSGTVTDASTGKTLPGVNISVKGTTSGAVTDSVGHYSVTAPSSADTLVFSYIGYQTQTIPINGRSTIDVALTPSTIAGQQLVVVGYGTQRKQSVTGSVSSISGTSMNEVPASNVSDALKGRLPGVKISQTSSKPGSPMQIRIRGTRSLNASNNPLIVLNGIPFGGSLSDINPDQIKSIDVLKDASATAIYGSRGANGVILIQTKKGQKNQKPKINYESYYGLKKIFSYYPMMNGPEFVALRKAAGQYSNGPDESNSTNTNWQKLFYKPSAAVMNQNLNISAGTDQGSYNLGFGYYHDASLIPTQKFERYTLNGSFDQGVGKYIQIGLNTNTNYNVSKGNQIGLYNVLSMSPIASPYNSDGSLKRTIRMPLDTYWNETRAIVDSVKNEWLNPIKTFGTYNTMYGIINIPKVEGLKYRINVGLNYSTTDNNSFTGEGINSSNATTPSNASINHSVTLNWTIENLLTYKRTFNDKHRVNVTALYSAEKDRYHSSDISKQGIPNPDFQFYNLGAGTGQITIDPNNQDYRVSGLESVMGRVIYSYENRYMMTATIRSDGSSRLAKGHQWHTYPAISVGWNMADESFMKNISQIDQLKLRVGYGETSNQAIAPYSTLGRLSTSPYNFGPTNYAVGYYVSQLPNANLGWEYSRTWNFGADFSLLNNRVSGTLEYYITHTNNVLLNVGLPATSGVSSYTANIGKTQNKGLELSVNGTIFRNHNGWTWRAGLNIYGNRNKLVKLASGQSQNVANNWFVGHPIDVIYDYKKIGLWQQGDKYLNTLEPGGNVGMIKVKYTGGYNSDGTPKRAIGPADRQVMNVNPKFEGGFNTQVGYKGFDLNVVGSFKDGGIIVSTLYNSAGYLDLLSGRRNNVNVDYWTPNHTNAKFPKPGGITSGDNPKYGSTLGYFDASYLKIRTITLGYDFTKLEWFKNQNTGISRLRLYFTVQNPFVMFSPFHKQSGLDPETNSYGDQNSAVSSYPHRILTVGTNTPQTRNYLLGIKLTF
ncbi:MAG TPA: TonB-dependent receptor [Balneolaceae bacterium]|nr:TonB-dependent receptor [Balneolaceae bacterium]